MNLLNDFYIKSRVMCSKEKWKDWKWQEQKSITTVSELLKVFPNIDKKKQAELLNLEKQIRIRLTPYMLSLIELDEKNCPKQNDPIWTQFIPVGEDTDISSYEENWELPNEMITPILQHKYANRVNFRIQNKCLAYCMYCFEAKRVLDKKNLKEATNAENYLKSINYVKSNETIQEVVISGGEPLTLNNEKLRKILKDLRSIEHIKCIRIQTRALTHNPYRIDEEFVEILKEYDVTAIAFHICHAKEISSDVLNFLDIFSQNGCRTMLLAHIPLLKGINDNIDTLTNLFMRLYQIKIKPYYLIHSMPDTFNSSKFRTSVRKGTEILKEIRRNYSNPSVPEYIIVHKNGKHTVPLEILGTPEFKYLEGVIEFKNWKGEWCQYKDGNTNADTI